jgi:tRNA(Ser,Leu) C12 N-acetylase TAN1
MNEFLEQQRKKLQTIKSFHQILTGFKEEPSIEGLKKLNRHRSPLDLAAKVNLLLEARQSFIELTLMIQALNSDLLDEINKDLVAKVVENNFMNLTIKEFGAVT